MKLVTIIILAFDLFSHFDGTLALYLREEDLRLACRLSSRYDPPQIIENLFSSFKERGPIDKLNEHALNQTLSLILTGRSQKLRDVHSTVVSSPTLVATPEADVDCDLFTAYGVGGIAMGEGSGAQLGAKPSRERGLGHSTSGYFMKRLSEESDVAVNSGCMDFPLSTPVNLANFEDVKKLIVDLLTYRAHKFIRIYEEAESMSKKQKSLSFRKPVEAQTNSASLEQRDNIVVPDGRILMNEDDLKFVCDSYTQNRNFTATFDSLIDRLRIGRYSRSLLPNIASILDGLGGVLSRLPLNVRNQKTLCLYHGNSLDLACELDASLPVHLVTGGSDKEIDLGRRDMMRINSQFKDVFGNLCSSFEYPATLDVSDPLEVDDMILNLEVQKQRMLVDYIQSHF